MGRPGGAGPPNVNLGFSNISETARAGKLKLKIPLNKAKYRSDQLGLVGVKFQPVDLHPLLSTSVCHWQRLIKCSELHSVT